MPKVIVWLPDDLLKQLDAEVKRKSTSRSAFLAAAARRELARKVPRTLSRGSNAPSVDSSRPAVSSRETSSGPTVTNVGDAS